MGGSDDDPAPVIWTLRKGELAPTNRARRDSDFVVQFTFQRRQLPEDRGQVGARRIDKKRIAIGALRHAGIDRYLRRNGFAKRGRVAGDENVVARAGFSRRVRRADLVVIGGCGRQAGDKPAMDSHLLRSS